MIERYSDHAANERTFLAWVRTAIAIMAFGFLVQKFDLFLRIASESLIARSLPERKHIVGDIAGLLLIVLGGAMMVLGRASVSQDHALYRRRRGAARTGDATGYHPCHAALSAGGNPVCLSVLHRDQ